MNTHLYILYSDSLDKHYVGITSKSTTERLAQHNNATYGSKSYTSIAIDWEIIFSMKCENLSHAIKIENKIKAMKSRIYISNFIKYPELRDRVYKETLL